MATDIRTRPITAEEFMEMDLGEGLHELVRGEVVEVPPPMPEHGRICINVGFTLEVYARRTRIGYVVSNDSAVVTERDPDTVRGADISFYKETTWPRSQLSKGLPPVPPDLVVEVMSPSNRPAEMAEKVREYLAAGTALVWVVHPDRKAVAIHRAGADAVEFGESETLADLPELPDFACPVTEFFI